MYLYDLCLMYEQYTKTRTNLTITYQGWFNLHNQELIDLTKVSESQKKLYNSSSKEMLKLSKEEYYSLAVNSLVKYLPKEYYKL